MAGIGFEIRKLMNQETFIGDFKAYFFAGLVSSGPWLVSILCLGLLWIFSSPYFNIESQKLFRVTVVYTYSFSIIITGFVQFALNRFLSDKLFLKQRNMFLPTYVAVILLTALVQAIVGMVFYSFADVDLYFKMIGIVLFIAVSCIWQTMIFLSASRDYVSIVIAFFWGNLAAFILGISLGRYVGFNGYFLGYTIGQVIIFFLLMYRIFYEFDSVIFCSFEFIRYIRKYFDLFLIGVFYYLAIWADKIIYWFSPSGEHNYSLFYSHYPYDSCMFLAFLTLIPALAHFLVDVETNFYDKYKGFYGSLVKKATLGEVEKQKRDMIQILKDATSKMMLLQMVVTGAFLCYAPILIDFLHLRAEHLPILWIAGVGSFFLIFFMLSLIVLLYFDRRKEALALSFLFLLANATGTILVIRYAPHLMGLGYASATFFSSIAGLILAYRNIVNIDYLTFISQPLTKPILAKAETGNMQNISDE